MATGSNGSQQTKTAAVPEEQDSGEKLVVRTSAFVARTDAKDKTATHRYRRGEPFKPVEGIHDVEALIRARVLGRHTKDNPSSPVTALSVSKAAADLNEEDSPVLDLESQPFEVTGPVDEDDPNLDDLSKYGPKGAQNA